MAAGDSAGGLAPRVDQNRPSPSPEKRAKAGQTGGGKEQPKQAAHNTEANKMAARKANNAENPSKKDSREANEKARKKHPAKMNNRKASREGQQR